VVEFNGQCILGQYDYHPRMGSATNRGREGRSPEWLLYAPRPTERVLGTDRAIMSLQAEL